MKLKGSVPPSSSIEAHSYYCGNESVYHKYIEKNDTFERKEQTLLHVYDSSINSSYFADGFSGWITVNASAPGRARVSVCSFTSKDDYDRLDRTKSNCTEVLDWKEPPYNGNESNTVFIRNTSSSYYFIMIYVEGAVTSLSYNFTTVQSYYNISDLATTPDCNITHKFHECDFHLSDEKCVMLFAKPELSVNTSTFRYVELKGEKETHQAKDDAYEIIKWVIPVISLLTLGFCLLLCFKLSCC